MFESIYQLVHCTNKCKKRRIERSIQEIHSQALRSIQENSREIRAAEELRAPIGVYRAKSAVGIGNWKLFIDDLDFWKI